MDPIDSWVPRGEGCEVLIRSKRPLAMISMCLLVLSSVSGCAYVPTRGMSYEPIAVSRPAVESWGGVVAVRSFEDQRPPRAYPGLFATLFLTYVPLLPYVKASYERLDESDEMTRWERGESYDEDGRFPNLVARTISDDLRQSGLFDEVVYIGNGPVPRKADFVLEGTLESTEFDIHVTSYMLGMAGVLLWFAPIPNGANGASVAAELRLVDREGDSLWNDRLEGRRSTMFSLYGPGVASISSTFSLEVRRYGSNDEGIDGDSLWAYHASAIRTGMEDVKTSLGAALRARDSVSP